MLDLSSRRTLISSLPKNFTFCVEVGVREGWFSRYILENTSMTVHSIDPWEKNKELGNPDQAYEICKKVLSTYGERSKMVKAYSPNISIDYQNESIDFVYIDGLHDYSSVISDINAWWPKIRKNGILSGHDFNEKKWPGVTAAVKEFCKNNDVVYQLTGLDNNFLNSKAGSVDDWDSDEFSWVIKKI